MDQVGKGWLLLRPARLSSHDFKQQIHQRGWRMADAAARWDVRPESLSRVAADPQRDLRWDDLVRALPLITRGERAAATAARRQLYPPRPRLAPTAAAGAPALPPAPWAWREDEDEDAELGASHADGFRYQDYVALGAELVVVSEIGSFAAEGVTLVVVDIRLGVDAQAGAQEEYLCQSPGGARLWLEPAQMDDWVVSTGKTRQEF